MFVRLDDPLDVSQETIGRPVSPDDEVRLLDDDDREILGGEVGELCCRGPYTLRGYFGVPEYNARTFTSNGFYRSGDLMRHAGFPTLSVRQSFQEGADGNDFSKDGRVPNRHRQRAGVGRKCLRSKHPGYSGGNRRGTAVALLFRGGDLMPVQRKIERA